MSHQGSTFIERKCEALWLKQYKPSTHTMYSDTYHQIECCLECWLIPASADFESTLCVGMILVIRTVSVQWPKVFPCANSDLLLHAVPFALKSTTEPCCLIPGTQRYVEVIFYVQLHFYSMYVAENLLVSFYELSGRALRFGLKIKSWFISQKIRFSISLG